MAQLGNVALAPFTETGIIRIFPAVTPKFDQYAQTGWQVQQLDLKKANTGVFRLEYEVLTADPRNLKGSITVDVGRLTAATLAEEVANKLNADDKLGPGAVMVVGDANTGLTVTFDEMVVKGQVQPLNPTSLSLGSVATVDKVGVGQATVRRESVVHELQRLTLLPAANTFSLTVTTPAGAHKTAADIERVAGNGAATATNIQNALNAAAVLDTNAVHVTYAPQAGGTDAWYVEFLLPGKINLIDILPASGAVERMIGGVEKSNRVQTFHLNGANAGSFKLTFANKETAEIPVVQVQNFTRPTTWHAEFATLCSVSR